MIELEKCPNCKGTGLVQIAPNVKGLKRCLRCDGKGKIPVSYAECPNCGGEGKYSDCCFDSFWIETCSECNGTGKIKIELGEEIVQPKKGDNHEI